MSTKGISYGSEGKKTFIPLENNPHVFTHLAQNLGLSPKLGFYDVFSIDEPELLAMVPRPAHSLIVIIPADIVHRVREDDEKLSYDGCGADEPVIWFPQTIGHSCGLMALIHSTFNGPARQSIPPSSDFEKILTDALPLKPAQRADLLYDSAFLEKAHMDAAIRGDSAAPASEEPSPYHFISFVKGKDGHLWELEGGWGGPIDRGALADGEDVLSERALEAGIRRFTRVADGNLEFSIVALADKEIGKEIGVSPEAILGTSHGRRCIDVLKIIRPKRANWEYICEMESQPPNLYHDDVLEIPGARALIDSLISSSAPWAIVTSATSPLITGWLSVLSLPKPEVLVTAESVEDGKPDPTCYLMGLEKLGLVDRAKDVLVLEDSPAGIRAGKAAGCKVLGLVTSHTVEQVVAAGPDWVVRDLSSVRVVRTEGGVATLEIVDSWAG